MLQVFPSYHMLAMPIWAVGATAVAPVFVGDMTLGGWLMWGSTIGVCWMAWLMAAVQVTSLAERQWPFGLLMVGLLIHLLELVGQLFWFGLPAAGAAAMVLVVWATTIGPDGFEVSMGSPKQFRWDAPRAWPALG